jgi:hypothetical protein
MPPEHLIYSTIALLYNTCTSILKKKITLMLTAFSGNSNNVLLIYRPRLLKVIRGNRGYSKRRSSSRKRLKEVARLKPSEPRLI